MIRNALTVCGFVSLALALTFAPIDITGSLAVSSVCLLVTLVLFLVAGLMGSSDDKINTSTEFWGQI